MAQEQQQEPTLTYPQALDAVTATIHRANPGQTIVIERHHIDRDGMYFTVTVTTRDRLPAPPSQVGDAPLPFDMGRCDRCRTAHVLTYLVRQSSGHRLCHHCTAQPTSGLLEKLASAFDRIGGLPDPDEDVVDFQERVEPGDALRVVFDIAAMLIDSASLAPTQHEQPGRQFAGFKQGLPQYLPAPAEQSPPAQPDCKEEP